VKSVHGPRKTLNVGGSPDHVTLGLAIGLNSVMFKSNQIKFIFSE